VLLGLQYLWLARLQETSAVAHTAYLGHYLEAVTRRVEYHYRSMAERSLNIPARVIEAAEPGEFASYFKKKPIKGAKEVFVLTFPRDGGARLMFYDRFLRAMVPKKNSPHLKAIGAASTPMLILRLERSQIDSLQITVHEQDPNTRIIINPIVDDDARLVGAAGIVVDPEHFAADVLPHEIEKAFKDFPGSEREVVVTVRDHTGDLIYSSVELEDDQREDDAQRALPFIFTDYSVGIQSRGMTPEQWAKVSFGVNMTMALLLALVVTGGLVLAFRSANRELKLSEMKGTFVSNVSHELRTPLASIRVFGEFLRLGRVRGDKVSEYGEYIETESRRLTQLINNILDFSKIESEAKTYDFEPADVAAIVVDTLRTFDVRLKHTGFEIELSKPEQPLPLAAVDRDAVRQAVNNLLDNAVKYSGDSRRIGVKLGTLDDFVTVAVRDYGIGISHDEQKKIFERFHRVSTGLVHDVKGSGLGLSIVRHVVTAHGGKVRVKSEPGKGSIFTVFLPVVVDDEAQGELPAGGEPPTESDRREAG
jgi:signal transduction histidine kinase